jgi:amino acid adenylation domain-containing protein
MTTIDTSDHGELGARDGARLSALEEQAAIVLGVDPAAPELPALFSVRSFIELGGDSLAAMRLSALAAERWSVDIPVGHLLSATPLNDVLTQVSVLPAVPFTAPSEASLSPTQQGMWLAEQMLGGTPYNLVFVAFIDGAMDRNLMADAIGRTVRRHEGLRAVFAAEDGIVGRRVLADHVPRIEDLGLDDDGAVDFHRAVRAKAVVEGNRPFDLAAVPPLRFLLASRGAERHALVMIVHHIMLDGWAVGLTLTEIFSGYDAMERGVRPDDGPATGMAGLSAHQERLRQNGVWDRQTDYWRDRLDGVSTTLDLPADRPRPSLQDPSGARIRFDLGASPTAQVAAAARSLGITPFAFLLGAFGLTLSRYTGTRCLLIGVPLAGRPTQELERYVGVAGNLVAVRLDVDEDGTVRDFFGGVRDSLSGSIDNGALPFEEVVARLDAERATNCHPLVQVSFGMHEKLVPRKCETRNLRVLIEESHGGGSQFDLTLLIRQSDPSFSGDLEFATAVWTHAEAAGFLEDYRAATERLAADLDVRIEDVRCMSRARRALLDRVNDTAQTYPLTSVEELFRAAVRTSSQAVAVRDGVHELSYAQLEAAAARQARLLVDAGVRPDDAVLVCSDRSIAEIVAVIGVLWAGASYVGVDNSLPKARLDQIVVKVDPAAVLAGPSAGAVLAESGIALVDSWDPSWEESGGGPLVAPAAPPDPDRTAYIAFTSGSTGEPKGVCVPHRAVIRLVHDARYVRLGLGERMLRLSPLAFDASTLEIWGALLSGATVEIFPPGLPSPTELGRFLAQRKVTVAWLTSGLFRLMAEFAPGSFTGMRQLLTGGDVVPAGHARRVLERCPGLVITNGYGPTENTTFTTVHSVTRADDVEDPLPIGRPIPNTRVYVLDQRHRMVPPGAIGELYAGGDGLGRGYVGDPAETARYFGAFSPDVPERLYRTGDLVRLDTGGRLQFLGRHDDQVKVRGFRIEPAEVRRALCLHPGVLDAVVAVNDGSSADKRLIAAWIPSAEGTVTPAELRDHLAERLPAYMVPALWTEVDRIPVTANGKVDRRALAAAARPVAADVSGPVAPADVQDRVGAVFVEVLGQDTVAEDDDFFARGGDSLRAINLIRILGEQLGVALPLREFLRNPTLSGLRRLAETSAARARDGAHRA